MTLIPRPKPVDPKLFAPGNGPHSTKFGLPADVVYCRACVYSNQKPNSAVEYRHNPSTKKETLHLNPDGLCDACLFARRKKEEIDWRQREDELLKVLDRFRRNDGGYDCLVPGSGGKDSFYAAHQLKYKYGMNPLTVTWAPHIYTEWGYKNFQAWIHAGFDNYLFTPNGRVHRLLTRLALERILHPFQPFILGQYYFVSKMALKLNIPLVFYGENAAEYGNKQTENKSATKDTRYLSVEDYRDVYLAGTSMAELIESFGLTKADLDVYLPARAGELEEKKVEVHHLGYYLKWHPQSNYYYAVEHGGFQASPERTSGTYNKYSSIDDKIDDYHYHTTYTKFGIGRTTYDASQEIRNGEITREEGIALVKKFDGEYPSRFQKDNLEYLSMRREDGDKIFKSFEQPAMDQEYFDLLCDSFRSPHIWQRVDNTWRLRRPVWEV